MSATAEAVRERPILFSGPMVRAILDGSKMQTRRVVRGRALEWLAPDMFTPEYVADPGNRLSPYGYAGDRLWVRETWCPVDDREYDGERWVDYRATPRYEASHPAGWDAAPEDAEALKWRPSIHMPRWASRLTLRVTDVRIERIQDITELDAEAEGLTKRGKCWNVGADWTGDGLDTTASGAFRMRWDELNFKRGYGWDANPRVWVVSFEREANA